MAAGTGELTKAVQLATQAAELARASGQFTFEALALHDVARLGAPAGVRQRLEELAGLLEGRPLTGPRPPSRTWGRCC